MILAAAAASASPVCVKMKDELRSHEQAWGRLHAEDDSFVAFNRRMYEEYRSTDNQRSWLRAQAKAAENQAVMSDKADRIVTLLLANKCKAPDHIPSWSTYITPPG